MDRKLIKIILLAAIVNFFLPFLTVSCGYEEVVISGMDMVFGKNIMGETVGGNIVLVLLLLLPNDYKKEYVI